MAQLEQLMVRGIRSVGTEEQDAQVIRFLNPLTIISGPNGTGKTTIIEALNFATSSSLPPGKMGTFLHSLQVSRKPRVDAMVKLQFFDTKRRNCVMTKRMTSTINPKTSKPKTSSEEGTIQITSKDGSVRSLSSKVCDLKKEMINLLAVPSAILDNVIFCHQEESCWPLSEPKELKTRFDRIFQLTKFVKALDQMKKTKKEYTTASHPPSTICKASKVVATMLMGRVVRGQRYTWPEYGCGTCIALGASLFLLSSRGSMEGGTATSMMMGVNAFSAVLCIVSLLEQGTLSASINFALEHEKFAWDTFFLSLSGATGQLFIYSTIDKFGPIVFAVIMTIRQMLSILLSAFYYGHPMSLWAILGFAIVFLSMFLDIYRRYFEKKTTRPTNSKP